MFHQLCSSYLCSSYLCSSYLCSSPCSGSVRLSVQRPQKPGQGKTVLLCRGKSRVAELRKFGRVAPSMSSRQLAALERMPRRPPSTKHLTRKLLVSTADRKRLSSPPKITLIDCRHTLSSCGVSFSCLVEKRAWASLCARSNLYRQAKQRKRWRPVSDARPGDGDTKRKKENTPRPADRQPLASSSYLYSPKQNCRDERAGRLTTARRGE